DGKKRCLPFILSSTPDIDYPLQNILSPPSLLAQLILT
ncbi:MAG: hypothetical protein ACI9E4_001134, partial [Pseudohongiellaceae bacterium]